MALILNIETSADNCSVALSREGSIVASLQSDDARSHANILTVLIQNILSKTGLTLENIDAVAVSKGPGSYTGLRIGISVAKGLCYGAGKPLIAINTLQSMMGGLQQEISGFDSRFSADTWFCPMLDARRQEVYMALFSKNGDMVQETSAEIVHDNSFSGLLAQRKLVFFGSGAAKTKNIIHHPNAEFVDNFELKAEYLTKFAEDAFTKKQLEDVAYFEPLYLKDFVATIAKRKVI